MRPRHLDICGRKDEHADGSDGGLLLYGGTETFPLTLRVRGNTSGDYGFDFLTMR
jgi:hypothetical protein